MTDVEAAVLQMCIALPVMFFVICGFILATKALVNLFPEKDA
ncbi:hypothetical protein [uncultured Veillonella sp.]|nr:hypothetical protein [uncultured Veillonella sp.]MDY3974785.1 hypothetical protein [Veillonella caviae]